MAIHSQSMQYLRRTYIAIMAEEKHQLKPVSNAPHNDTTSHSDNAGI